MRTDAFANDDEFIDRLISVLKEEDHFGWEAMLLNEKSLDHAKSVFGWHLKMLNLAASFDLIEDIDKFHGSHSLGGNMSSWPYCLSPSLILLIAASEGSRKAQA
jgi:hypothetical protein